MKRTVRRTGKGLPALLAAGFLAAGFLLFYRSVNRQAALSDYTYEFTFISPFANDGYWGHAAYGMLQADEKYHANTKFISFAQTDEADTASAVYSAMYANTDGIIIAGERTQETVDALNAAAASGIPVVLIDNDNPDIDRICYIGTNNYEAGRMAGRDMTEQMEEPMQIAVILAGMEVENQAERYQGFADEIALHEECSIAAVLEADYNLLTVKEQLPELLEEHPEINAIFCAEGYSSSIVGTVVESLGFSAGEIRIVGFDKTEEILAQVESGRYYSTIAQRSDCMGELAVKALADYQNGILPEQDIIYTEITSIRRENLAQAVRYESEGVTWHLFNGTIRTTQLTGN